MEIRIKTNIKTMKNEIIKIDAPELNGLEKSKAEKIRSTFEPMAVMLSDFEKSFEELINEAKKGITKEITQKAKRLRLDVGKVRIETGKIKDQQKEYIKLEDKAIMGVHNILVWAVKEKEDRLKEIETFFEIQEQKRLNELQKNRVDHISPYLVDAHERQLSNMEDDVWNAYFQSKKKEHEDRIDAERKAELERIEAEKRKKRHIDREYEVRDYGRFFDWDSSHQETSDEDFQKLIDQAEKKKSDYEDEQEKIRVENERLKKEAEAEKAKIEAERKNREAKERKERAEYEAKLKAEREAKEKLEREAKQREEEQKAKEEAEKAKIEAELKKGDSEKVKDLINDLTLLKDKYSFESEKYKNLYADTGILIDKVTAHLCK